MLEPLDGGVAALEVELQQLQSTTPAAEQQDQTQFSVALLACDAAKRFENALDWPFQF
jgi:hypothetical protein